MKNLNAITLIGFVTAFTLQTKAAIVYTDINDATLGSGSSIDINIDGAGGAEYTIDDNSFGGPVEPGIFFNSADEHFVTVSAAEWDVIAGIPQNTLIDGSSGWHDAGDAYIDPFWGTTTFPTGNDSYIGASFKIAGNTHYGWIRVNWDGNGTFIVKDFAYEDVAGVGIQTGDQGGSSTILVTSITVEGQGSATTITTQGGTLQMQANVLPMNATDNTITWSVTNGTGSASISASGLMTAISDGIVTAVATANDGSGIVGSTQITISNQSTVGIEEFDFSNLIFSPNPFSNILTMTNETAQSIDYLSFYTITGKKVKDIFVNSSIETIDLSNLENGIYMVQIIKDNRILNTKKVIKK